MVGDLPPRFPASADFRGCRGKRISLRGAIGVAITLFVSAVLFDLSNPAVPFAISPAFAKKDGDARAAVRAARREIRQQAKAARRGSADDTDEAEESGAGEDPGGGVIDFHDEGFASRREIDVRSYRDNNRDFDGVGRKGHLEDAVGPAKDMDLKGLKESLRDGFGARDNIDSKVLKQSLGEVDAYVRPQDAGVADRNGHSSEDGRSQNKGRAAEGGKDVDVGEILRAKQQIKDFGADQTFDFKPPKRDWGTAEESVKTLSAGAAGKGGQDSEDRGNQKKNGSLEVDGTRKETSSLQTLKAEKSDLKESIANLKDERKDATKSEKKELKAEIKELKKELKDVKNEIKAAKADIPAQNAESSVAQNNGGSEIQLRTGSYASREVLALGLSLSGAERVRALGFQVSSSTVDYGGTTLRTLFAPDRMDALQALRLLRRELASDSFHLNRIYRPYYPSKNDDAEEGRQPVPDPADKNCSADRCYSRAVLHWKDDLAKCTRDISIGVIDTDIDLKHPTFAGQKIVRKTFVDEGKKLSPNWHGTGILALLAGRPDSGTPGLVPDAKFFFASSFFADDNGEAITDTVSLLRSLEWMGASGVKVVNMSFTGPDDVLVQGRIKTLRSKGFVFTAAAGNDGPAASPNYPAAYSEVVAVTAVTKDLRIYPSANRGSYIDLAAPGVRIWTALPDGRAGYRTGTSFATPFATAVLALQRSDLMAEPEEQLLDNLKTVPLGLGERNQVYGRGLVQAPSECPGSPAIVSSKAPAPVR